jgi:alpha-tubulin suppressor-like RCC1 family protein
MRLAAVRRRVSCVGGVWFGRQVALGTLLGLLVFPSVAEAGSARQIAAGVDHSCALTTTGAVMCWGENGYGQLGDGTTTDRATPVTVTGLSGGVAAVGAGRNFSCALTVDGGVKCWGDSSYGQLGNGTTTESLTPVDVTGLTIGVAALSVGRNFACALTTVGGVKCWGQDSNGQLGDGGSADQSTPVAVSGLSTGVESVAAAGHHTCAVTIAGAAMCWGYNEFGQLGDGTVDTPRRTPAAVTGLTSGVIAVTGGTNSTCALTTAGGVKCWGQNVYGQIGDGASVLRMTPTAVTGLTSGVVAIKAGFTHACAVLGSGALWCWGENADGQIGDGTSITPRRTPTAVTGLGGDVATAALGEGHTCALAAGGGVTCWGRNASGQLGDSSTTGRLTPVGVAGLTGGGSVAAPGARQVAPGGFFACALTNAGGVECWGDNSSGQLGHGTTTERHSPVPVHGLSGGVVAVTAGSTHACALTGSGGVKCWGDNTYGQLGNGTTTDSLTPVDVSGLTSGVAAVESGRAHVCAVTTSGALKCWGYNGDGQIGDNSTANRSLPTDVTGLTAGVAAVAGGGHHTCAVTSAGGVKCWGDNAYGQLGNGTTTDSLTPIWVNGLSSGAAAVSLGNYFTCALTTGGAGKCWGRNDDGQVGDGTTTARTTPVNVTGLTSGVSAVDAGSHHACARASGGRVQCWGDNANGEIGDGTTTDRLTPVDVTGLAAGATSVAGGIGLSCAVTGRAGVQCWGDNSNGQVGDGTSGVNRSSPRWVTGLVAGAGTVSLGYYFSCRVTSTGGAQCWGRNDNGQLGDGTTTNRPMPVDVSGLASGVVAVAAGAQSACALTSAGGVKCWGANSSGQLGDGTTTERHAPVDVLGRTSGTVAIAAGVAAACAVATSGGVQCWGNNHYGQLGDGTTTNRNTPGWVLGLTSGVDSVVTAIADTCARTDGGGVKCWGNNSSGELGDGTATNRWYPAFVSGLTSGVAVVSTSANATSSCALTTAGGVRCWGSNYYGQLGDGTTTNRGTPVTASGLTSGVAAVSVGDKHACAVTSSGGAKCWGDNGNGQLGDGTTTAHLTPTDVTGQTLGAGAVCAGVDRSFTTTAAGSLRGWGSNLYGMLGDATSVNRVKPVAVRGSQLQGDYDADSKADVAVYRPSAGTWFSLDSSSGNASFQYRGWGVQAQGDVPVSGCDFDGDGVVDPTVFRPASGTWFILKSSANYTTWDHFGWGSSGDTPVPADYDGDGITDGAVYRPSTGTWYIRPSSGATQWSVTFGNATDVPVPGAWDADGKADIAVYRASTGTWFVLTSASNYTTYWYKGWGVDAQGDTPAPGDYDGDGKLDPCVFRASTGTWFVLESHAGFTTWSYDGWGTNGDTVAPGDYDGDGITDVAVYRPSTYTWYVRPSSGAAQWSVVFGASGDAPLVTIR